MVTPSTLDSTLRRVAAGSAWILLAAAAVHGQLPAGATGIHVSGVECRNLSSGTTVRSTATETEWDCVDLGLSVAAGDLVAVTVRGRVPRDPSGQLLQAGPAGSSVAPFLVESEISDRRGDGSFAAADLDLDGDMDLIVEVEFRWLEFVTDDPPTFVEHDLPTDSIFPLEVRTLDINGDGRPDIISSFPNGPNPNRISWQENVPGDPPVFVDRVLYRESGWLGWKLGGADLDGDGDQDVLSWNTETDGSLERLVWHENDGSGQAFTAEVIYEVEAHPFFASAINFEVGDLDGDGDLDIFASANEVEMVWLENDGEPNPSWQRHLVDSDFVPPGLGLGDFDRDGDLDAVAGPLVIGDDEIRLYENVDGAFDQILSHSLGFFFNGNGPRVVDLNADGWLDLFLTSSTSTVESFYWLENRGSLSFVEHSSLQVDEMVPGNDVLVVDLEPDGDMDVIGSSKSGLSSTVIRVEAEMTVGGWSSALTLDRVRCLNPSTGQSVSISDPTGISFDCEAMGLAVSPGDQVTTTIRGFAQ